jgi:putative ABC transport system permease protein
MIRNYFKIAWRNLVKNKAYSAINILGLAVGMAVAILIALWIREELGFNKSFENHDRIVRFFQHSSDGKSVSTMTTVPIPLLHELRNKYATEFEHLAITRFGKRVLSFDEKKLNSEGLFSEPGFADIFSLQMLQGSATSLQDPSTVLLSATLANSLFGDESALEKVIKVDNEHSVRVGGVFQDFPENSEFGKMKFVFPWAFLEQTTPWIRRASEFWNNNSFYLFGSLADGKTLSNVQANVKDALVGKPDRFDSPEIFLQPMSRWHLYSEFKDGVNTGGAIRYVWMFGLIGFFVLLLACINFMNLSTARSQKRAKEVGIRKTMGSDRSLLVAQFLIESILITLFSSVLAILLVLIAIPGFNQLADKQISFPWNDFPLWLTLTAFILVTGLLAGSYPALYLSSFNPTSVLKGTFKAGRLAAIPRQALVVFQFTVSVSLIIGTLVIFQQIQHVKSRPLGYDKERLITTTSYTPDLRGKYELVKNELIRTGVVSHVALASNSPTEINSRQIGFEWRGKDPNINSDFSVSWVNADFGKTVGWDFLDGRDFSADFGTDSSGMILNEAAVRHMEFAKPVGETINFNGEDYQVIGVIEDVIMESPFDQAQPTVFLWNPGHEGTYTLKIDPSVSMASALPKIKEVFERLDPSSPFDYSFVDDDFAKKFAAEQRIGSLATFFAAFAVFISCLGIFGLASFMAEQRVKEIGVRKVLGATVAGLWRLLSKDFLQLVSIAILIAIPSAWYFMNNWLDRYDYRTDISLWTLAVTAVGVTLVTLLTVSFQAIKAAIANPVKSLRDE